MHRSISTEYNTFIGRSGDGKRGRGGATRESGTHYGVSVTGSRTSGLPVPPGETDDRTDLRLRPTAYGRKYEITCHSGSLRLERQFLGFTMLATFRGGEGSI